MLAKHQLIAFLSSLFGSRAALAARTRRNPYRLQLELLEDRVVPAVPVETLQFSDASYSVTENEGFATIAVTRIGGSTGAISVEYATTASGSATAGLDYTAVSGTLNFADSQVSATFTIPIVDDDLVESTETVDLTLTNPTGGAALGTANASLSIVDDDIAGTLQFSAATYTVNENAGNVTITVTRTNGSDGAVSVNYATTTGGSAANGLDYTAVSGTLSFASGETSRTFTIPILDGNLVEGNETINLILSSPTGGAVLGTATASVIIVDDDAAIISISSANVIEGGTLVFHVTIDNPVDIAVFGSRATANGTATVADSDYTPINAMVVTLFAAYSTTPFSISVSTTADSKVELDETISLVLANLSAGGRNVSLAGGGVGIGTINNDDSAVVSLVASASVAEGGILAFSVTMTNPVDVAVGATAVTSDGTATSSDLDYTAINSAFTLFPSGATTFTIHVGTTTDNKVELDETISLMLSNLSVGGRSVTFFDNAFALNSTGHILNNDAALISISSTPVAEGGLLAFRVSMSNPVDVALTAHRATIDGTATVADSDYTALAPINATLFEAGSTSFTIHVSTTSDNKVELDEQLFLNLSNLFTSGRNVVFQGSGESLLSSGTITNDDAAIISVSSPSVVEGGTLIFDVTISNPVDVAVAANVASADFLATTTDADYTALSPANVTLFAVDSVTTFSVSVSTTADSKVELNETLLLVLSSLSAGGRNVTLANGGNGVGTIVNDDAAIISINSPTVAEGGTLVFNVTLSNPVDVDVNVVASTSDGTASAIDLDYTPLNPNGTMFAPGSTSFTLNVNTTADNKVELNETLSMVLSALSANGRNVTFAGEGTSLSGAGTITNNDSAEISLASATVLEGGTLAFSVTMTNPIDVNVTATRATADGSATVADSDYTPLNSTALLFPAGATTFTLHVDTTADNKVELDETMWLVLSGLEASGRNVRFAGNVASLSAIGAITNNDAALISINNPSVTEGGVLEFNLTMSNPVDVAVLANYATADVTATNADYTALSAAGVTLFPVGSTSYSISVNTTADNSVELHETLSLILSSLSVSGRNVQFSSGVTLTGVGTIINDDAALISISNPSVIEGGILAFVVSMSNPVDVTVTANIATTNGTATTADSDYTALSSTGVTLFAAGSTLPVTFHVLTTADSRVELNETLSLVISALSASGRNVSVSSGGLGTILNDDFSEIDVRGNSVSIVNGDSTPSADDHTHFGSTFVGSSALVRTFTIANTGEQPLEFSTVQISGVAAADFSVTLQPTSPVVGPYGTTTFEIAFAPKSPGLRSATVTIPNNDADESPYTFTIQGESRQHLVPGQTLSFTDEDGDSYRISIGGLGRATIEIDDANGNGRGPIKSIVLEDTDPEVSTLRIVVQGGTGDRQVSIGSITGTGVKQIVAPSSDLVGSGIDLPGAPDVVKLRDILNGADIRFGGTTSDATKIQVRDIGANSDIELGSVLSLKAASVAAGGVITGTTIRKLEVARNILADVDLSGDLGSARVGGGIADATWSILGNVGTLSVRSNTSGWDLDIAGSLAKATLGITNRAAIDVGTFVGSLRAVTFTNSRLYVGTSDASSFTAGGTIKSFAVGGKVPNAFSNSMVAADLVGKVKLKSVNAANSTAFGIRAGTSIQYVSAASPRLVVKSLTAGDPDEGSLQFRVMVV